MKSVLLIGLGRFGSHTARKLNDLNVQVMAVDSDEERVNAALPYVTNAQIGDSTSREFLSTLGVHNFDACIVAIGDNFQNSLVTTDLLKELGAKSPGPPGGYRRNSCCAAARTRWSIRKNSWRHGRQSAVLQSIFWIISSWTGSIPSLSCPSRRSGGERPFFNWSCGNGTASTFWACAGMESWK